MLTHLVVVCSFHFNINHSQKSIFQNSPVSTLQRLDFATATSIPGVGVQNSIGRVDHGNFRQFSECNEKLATKLLTKLEGA